MTRRILVVRLDSMGDVLVSGPAVRAIAATGRVTMLCSPRGEAAARLLPGVEDVMVWDAPWVADPAPSVADAELPALVRELAARRFDSAVILTSFHQSPLPTALTLRLAGVHRITGASVDYPGTLLDVRVRPGVDVAEDVPEAVRALAIARAAGHELPPGDDGRLRVSAPTRPRERDLVVVHPGAAVPARIWPEERHAETVRLLATAGLRVLVTGGQSERELTRRVAGVSGVDLGGSLDTAGLAEVLSGAGALIAGNTGPAHLAAAVGTPVVSLFSPVVPAVRWAPYGVPVVLLGDQHAACRGSRARQCPVPGHPCLAGVTAAEAVDACLTLLAVSANPAGSAVRA